MLAAATTQVIRSYLLSAAEEMRRTLVRQRSIRSFTRCSISASRSTTATWS